MNSFTECHAPLKYGEADPTTRRMLESILADEETHANEMAGLLVKVDQTTLGLC
jgi:bacterioferritin (cytochrome b1)